uniref:SET domain-containing protein n=1 Tax=Caenorhabditis tropicalis TaxID=1561998 RepID=A0A1I7TJQ4_9PELO
MNTRSKSAAQQTRSLRKRPVEKNEETQAVKIAKVEVEGQFYSVKAAPKSLWQAQRQMNEEIARSSSSNSQNTRKKSLRNKETMKFGNDKYLYTDHNENNDDRMWQNVKNALEARESVFGTDGVNLKLPSEQNMDSLCKAQDFRRWSFLQYSEKGCVLEDTVASDGKEIMRNMLKNSTEEDEKVARDEINKIIADAGSGIILKGSSSRREIKNGNFSVFVNKTQLENLTESAMAGLRFELIDRNIVDKAPFDKKIQTALENLEREEEKPPYKETHHYTCTPECVCCRPSGSFPAPPKGALEPLIHTKMVKGITLRSRQYFDVGESVTDFFGNVIHDGQMDDNNYAFELYSEVNDRKVFEKMIRNNESKSSRPLSEDYCKNLKELIGHNFSIDPKQKGSIGRFISSSCMGNLVPHVVYKNGINPLNAEIAFTACMPIYPQQELSFFYSCGYIYKNLKDSCLCGELCCIRNMHLFPYIRKDDVIKFYKKLYGRLHEEFKLRVLTKNSVNC